MLTAYHWPGNVRELENVIERAVLVCDAHVVHGHHLPPTLQTAQASGTISSLSLSDAVTAFEKDIVLDALKTSAAIARKPLGLLGTTERIINYKSQVRNRRQSIPRLSCSGGREQIRIQPRSGDRM